MKRYSINESENGTGLSILATNTGRWVDAADAAATETLLARAVEAMRLIDLYAKDNEQQADEMGRGAIEIPRSAIAKIRAVLSAAAKAGKQNG